ncbi:MAG: hypothetical protein K8S87_06610, partial [Planctomycetes bacterium]|nr:hypothetical protein [Planctomycetota bacterium]
MNSKFFFLLLLQTVIVLLMILGCSGTETDNPLKQCDKDVIKIFSSKDLKTFLSQVYTEDRKEFSFYIKELSKDSVNQATKDKLVEILQNPKNNEYYVATMLYLMAKAGIDEVLHLTKTMMYHPDAYIKSRCISAFSMLADRSERNLLLPLVSKNEKFEKVRTQATKVYYSMISAEDFDILFKLIENPTSKIKKDADRRKFIINAIYYCLDKLLDDKTRKQKENYMISQIGKTSIIAEEFLLEYFKGRLTTNAFPILVELYCDYGKSRKIHVLSFGEIHRLIKTGKIDLDLANVSKTFVNVLIKDIVFSDKHNDIFPADIEFILENFEIEKEDQKVLEQFILSLDIDKNSSDSLKFAYRILMTKGEFNDIVEKIIANSKVNENLLEINLKAISRFIDKGVKKDSVAEILSEIMIMTEKESTAKYCAKQLADINSETAISYMLEGLKHENHVITDASAFGLIWLSDKSYFTELVREDELINKILRNEEMEEHNIISTLQFLGNVG